MTKQKKLRNLEYYDLQPTFDDLYAKSKNGVIFGNLTIVNKSVHVLIHATQPETINAYLNQTEPTQTMLKKINKLRIKAGNTAI